MRKAFFRVALLFAGISFIITACKKDNEVTTQPVDTIPASTEQLFSLQIKTSVGNTPADFVNVFTDATGRKFTLSEFRYYLSKIVLIKSDDTEISISDSVILGDVTQKIFPLAVIPVGNYKGLRMLFGLDSAMNHGDPTVYPASSPLSLQNNTMHWNWNSGYIFMKLEGKADTTVNNTGVPDTDLLFHVGDDKLKRVIDLGNSPFVIASGSDYIIKLNIDLQKLFDNIDLRTDRFAMGNNNLNLSSKLADNWPSAITVQ